MTRFQTMKPDHLQELAELEDTYWWRRKAPN